MAKVSKFFRIGVAGDTCDGREISAIDIDQMADSFDPRVYGCRINLEHYKGLLPDSQFKRYGDVLALKADTIDDDSALKGKRALFAQISPTDELVTMTGQKQKIYTSMEIQPNFANSGKAYLVGLAVTDDPASLGTEMLAFSASAQVNPLASRKTSPENLFSAATEVELVFDEVPEPGITLLSRIKGLFAAKQTSDEARFIDIHAAVEEVASFAQKQAELAATHLTTAEKALNERINQLEQTAEADRAEVVALTGKLATRDSTTQPRRPYAHGGLGKADVLTDC
ncbi:MAG: GPO family capsid scaffolding protein [Rouxiella aceris]|uniref:GPO family capsid scaffolding protein n=1 Tax=Rouxiella aceris TaxID=2703884 RepID=UPI002849C310|nr:GPO family capsid scaffolding protein [Rouxiella aceris]MDR3432071.1 GPO family capsid scaffolding protein [Rouxiella aceris]